jgi:HEAT repeat protein
LLSHGSNEEKTLALSNLPQLLNDPQYRNNPATFDPILNALNDRDPSLREAAAASLKSVGKLVKGNCADGRIVASLISALNDDHPGVRREAAKALGFYRDRRAVAPLAEKLQKEDDPWVRLEAAYSLGELNAKKAFPALLFAFRDHHRDWGSKIVAQECVIALRKIGYRDAELIQSALTNINDAYLRAEIIKTLGRFRSMAAEEALIQATADPSPVIRKLAVQAIDQLPMIRTSSMDGDQHPKFDIFSALLKDPSEDIRVVAAEALARTGDKRAVESLLEVLHDSDRAVRMQAMTSLGRFHDERILAALVPFFEPSTRELAASSFLNVSRATASGTVYVYRDEGERYAVRTLMEIPRVLKDNHPSYRDKMEALIQEYPTSTEKQSKDDSGMLRKVSAQRSHREHIIHPGAVDVLVRAMKGLDINVRMGVLGMIQKFEDDRIEPLLITLLDDPAKEIRLAAMAALHHYATRTSLPVIIKALDDKDAAVRGNAARMLGVIGGKDVVNPLLKKLDDDNADVRDAALSALGKFDDPRISDASIRMLKDESSKVRRTAIVNIRLNPDKKAVLPLISLLSDPDTCVMAARTLGQIGDPRAVDPLIEALSEKSGGNQELMVTAARILSSFEERRILPHLIKKVGETYTNVGDFPFLLPAMRILNRYEEREKIEMLRRHIEAADKETKKGAVFLLAMDQDAKGLQLIEVLLDDDDPELRVYASEIVAGIKSGALKKYNQPIESIPIVDAGGLRPIYQVPMRMPSKGEDADERGRSQKIHWRHTGIEKKTSGEIEDPAEKGRLITQYVNQLKHGSAGERKAALGLISDVVGLAEYRKDPTLVGPILTALIDKDPSIRKAAAASLERIGEKTWVITDSNIVYALIMALTDADSGVRCLAAKSLAFYKDRQALEPLAERLYDQDSNVRKEAAASLGRLKSTKEVVFALLDMFNDDTEWDQKSAVRYECLVSLGKTGSFPATSVPLLLEHFNDEILRVEIVRALGRSCSPDPSEIKALLLKAREDPNQEVRKSAVEALARQSRKQTRDAPKDDALDIDQYIEALEDSSPGVRSASVKSLAETGNPKAVEPIINALHDDDAAVQEAAIIALGKFKDERILRELLPFLGSASGMSNPHAMNSFSNVARNTGQKEVYIFREDGTRHVVNSRGEIPPKASFWNKTIVHPGALDAIIDALNDNDSDLKISALNGIQYFEDDRIEPLLIRMLGDPSPAIRSLALDRLRYYAAERAVPAIVGALSDSDPEIRKKAAGLLGVLESREAVVPLLECLDDGCFDVRRSVILALGRIKDERAIKPLTEQLSDRKVEIRKAALNAFLYFENPSVLPLNLKMLQDESPEVRRSAVWNITNKPDNRAVEPLLPLLDDKDICVSAAGALGVIGDSRAVEPLIRALNDGNRGLTTEGALSFNLSAVNALGRLGGEEAVKALIDIAENHTQETHLRITAVNSLGDIGDKAATMPLASILSDKQSDIWLRAAAASALGKIGDERAVDPLLKTTHDIMDAPRHAAEEALKKMGRFP